MFAKAQRQEDRQCRICFEADEARSRLVSPCRCKGSQKFVHEECLGKWQRIAMAHQDYRKAYFCPVCNSRYTHASIPWIMLRHTWHLTVRLSKVFITVLSMVWLIPITIVLKAVLLAATVFVPWSLLSYGGYTLTYVGSYNQPVLIRTGSPVQGLQRGTLLVASRNMPETSLFYRAVVLITEHSAFGSRGFILNRPVIPRTHAPSTQVEIGVGGPVERWRLTLVHARPMQGSQQIVEGVYVTESPPAEALASQISSIQNATLPDNGMRVLRGYAGWAPNQLAGEIRAGVWHHLPSSYTRVLGMSTEQHWDMLIQCIENRLDSSSSAADEVIRDNALSLEDTTPTIAAR